MLLTEFLPSPRRAGRGWLLKARIAALLLACAFPGSRSLIAPPAVRHDAGVAASPAEAWQPPADAVPLTQARVEAKLPEGISPDTQVTLAQVVDIALANNPAIREAWLNARAAQ